LLLEIGRVSSSDATPEEVSQSFAPLLGKLIQFDRAVINSIDRAARTCTAFWMAGIELEGVVPGETAPLDGSLTLSVANAKRGFLIQGQSFDDAAKKWPRLSLPQRAGVRSFMAVPLLMKNDVVGVLALHSLAEYAYTERDLQVCELVARQIAGAVSHTRLFSARASRG
jgi:GAF domain-containing protein